MSAAGGQTEYYVTLCVREREREREKREVRGRVPGTLPGCTTVPFFGETAFRVYLPLVCYHRRVPMLLALLLRIF